MQWQMIELPAFMRVRDSIFADDFDFAEFQQMLASNPLAGNEIQGTGGLRKVRWRSRKSEKGKSGGSRTIYLVSAIPAKSDRGMIFLLYAYNKAVKADLQADEKRVLRQLASELKEEIKRTFANKEF